MILFTKLFWMNMWNSLKLSYSVILYSILGNLFPLYIGGALLFFIKEDFNFYELISGRNLIIFSATFFMSSLYLWNKNSKKNSGHLGLIIHLLLAFSIVILFVVSYIEPHFNNEYYTISVFIVFAFSIGIYIISELTNSYNIVISSPEKFRQKQYENLQKQFDNLEN